MALSRYRELAADRSGRSSSASQRARQRARPRHGDMADSAHRPSQVRGHERLLLRPGAGGQHRRVALLHAPSLEKRLDALKKLEVELTASGPSRHSLRSHQAGGAETRRPLRAAVGRAHARERTGPRPVGQRGLCFKAGSARRRSRPMTKSSPAQLRRQDRHREGHDRRPGFQMAGRERSELDGLVTRITAPYTMVEHGLGHDCCAPSSGSSQTPPATAPFECLSLEAGNLLPLRADRTEPTR